MGTDDPLAWWVDLFVDLTVHAAILAFALAMAFRAIL